jgi:hypothetical protein
MSLPDQSLDELQSVDTVAAAAYVTGKQRHDRQGTATVPAKTALLIEKIRALPEERLNEVEDFIDFIRLREQQRALASDAAAARATAFAAVWSNPEDDVYDAL